MWDNIYLFQADLIIITLSLITINGTDRCIRAEEETWIGQRVVVRFATVSVGRAHSLVT